MEVCVCVCVCACVRVSGDSRLEKKAADERHAYTQAAPFNYSLLLHVGMPEPVGMQTAMQKTGSIHEFNKAGKFNMELL